MDIANKFMQIGIFITHDGSIPVLEKMSAAVIAMIEVDGISGEKAAHQVGKTGLPGAQ